MDSSGASSDGSQATAYVPIRVLGRGAFGEAVLYRKVAVSTPAVTSHRVHSCSANVLLLCVGLSQMHVMPDCRVSKHKVRIVLSKGYRSTYSTPIGNVDSASVVLSSCRQFSPHARPSRHRSSFSESKFTFREFVNIGNSNLAVVS